MPSEDSKRVLLSKVISFLDRKGVRYSKKDLMDFEDDQDEITEHLEAALCRAKITFGFAHSRISNTPALQKCKPILEEFMEEFELELVPACDAFAWVCMEIMERKFQINKIPFYHERIFRCYEYNLVVSNDPSPELTSKIFTAYCMVCNYLAGNYVKELQKPANYFHFVYAAEESRQCMADPMAWVKAHHQAFKHLGFDLEPYHLYGPKARQRYLKTDKQLPVRTRRDRTSLRYESNTD